MHSRVRRVFIPVYDGMDVIGIVPASRIVSSITSRAACQAYNPVIMGDFKYEVIILKRRQWVYYSAGSDRYLIPLINPAQAHSDFVKAWLISERTPEIPF